MIAFVLNVNAALVFTVMGWVYAPVFFWLAAPHLVLAAVIAYAEARS